MIRKVLCVLVLLLLLCGCAQRRQPDVEHFQGDVVATLQKPLSLATPEPLGTSLPPSGESEITAQASQIKPTDEAKETPDPKPSDLPSDSYPVTTGTAALTPEPSRAANLTQTATPTLGIPVWQGGWKIWFQTASGGYNSAELTVQVTGMRLSASAKIDGIDYTFSGDIYTQDTQVKGDWETASSTGTFWWRMNSADSFVGSREARFGFCGSRTMTVQPNPCREVPQN